MDGSASLLSFLQIEKAPSDTVRAEVLDALITYAEAVGLEDVLSEAKRLMPAAHPLVPPQEWLTQYLGSFGAIADTECGVDPDEGPRYAVEYWQMLTDEARNHRLSRPWLGEDDGRIDAAALNAA